MARITIGRASTQLINSFGIERKTIQKNGLVLSGPKNSSNSSGFFNIERTLSGLSNIESGYLSSDKFDVIKAYFDKKGLSTTMSSAMAMLISDISKTTGINSLHILDEIKRNYTGASIPEELYRYLNLYRDSSNQHQYSRKVDNGKSNRYRQVKP